MRSAARTPSCLNIERNYNCIESVYLCLGHTVRYYTGGIDLGQSLQLRIIASRYLPLDRRLRVVVLKTDDFDLGVRTSNPW